MRIDLSMIRQYRLADLLKTLIHLGNRQELLRIRSRSALLIPSRKPQILALRLSENSLRFA